MYVYVHVCAVHAHVCDVYVHELHMMAGGDQVVLLVKQLLTFHQCRH